MENEIQELRNELKELQEKVRDLTINVRHMQATDIIKARQLEDSVLNRTLLKEIVTMMREEKKLNNDAFDKAILEGSFSDQGNKTINELMKASVLESILKDLKNKKKLSAIKTVREITNLGLREAKYIVDELQTALLK